MSEVFRNNFPHDKIIWKLPSQDSEIKLELFVIAQLRKSATTVAGLARFSRQSR